MKMTLMAGARHSGYGVRRIRRSSHYAGRRLVCAVDLGYHDLSDEGIKTKAEGTKRTAIPMTGNSARAAIGPASRASAIGSPQMRGWNSKAAIARAILIQCAASPALNRRSVFAPRAWSVALRLRRAVRRAASWTLTPLWRTASGTSSRTPASARLSVLASASSIWTQASTVSYPAFRRVTPRLKT